MGRTAFQIEEIWTHLWTSWMFLRFPMKRDHFEKYQRLITTVQQWLNLHKSQNHQVKLVAQNILHHPNLPQRISFVTTKPNVLTWLLLSTYDSPWIFLGTWSSPDRPCAKLLTGKCFVQWRVLLKEGLLDPDGANTKPTLHPEEFLGNRGVLSCQLGSQNCMFETGIAETCARTKNVLNMSNAKNWTHHPAAVSCSVIFG